MKRSPLNPYNPERRKRLYERNFGEKAHWIRKEPCAVTDTRRNVVAAHMKARGMGGAGGSKEDLVPLNSMVHHDFDTMPEEKWEAKYGMTKQEVRDLAPEYERRWQEVKETWTRDLPQ